MGSPLHLKTRPRMIFSSTKTFTSFALVIICGTMCVSAAMCPFCPYTRSSSARAVWGPSNYDDADKFLDKFDKKLHLVGSYTRPCLELEVEGQVQSKCLDMCEIHARQAHRDYNANVEEMEGIKNAWVQYVNTRRRRLNALTKRL